MTADGTLSAQVTAYHNWKKDLVREITRYRSWLQDSELLSEDLARHLQRGIELLVQDELTIAFVGEYSRGKTELINALFLAEYGQRMLPSQAGRTTMCPTEVFFDRRSRQSYVRLLPIETRNGQASLQELRHSRDAWDELSLDLDDPESTRNLLARVAEVKSLSRERARELGFDEAMLDEDPQTPQQVLVPAWRHAMISIRHPLLERGLRILDTPGLNALGSEPELTISMLPSAQAVLFLLSADAGVTASDMRIWSDYIDTENADHRAGRFAVLNKIDTLWDDPDNTGDGSQSIDAVRQTTARQLGLTSGEVLPVSAKQGLLAQIRQDSSLRQRSQLPVLESLISERILSYKERLITHNLVNDLTGMLQANQAALQGRIESLQEELQALQSREVDRDTLARLAEQTRRDYDFYYKKLITLKSSRRLVESQSEVLLQMLSMEQFEAHARKTREKLESDWTTLGLNNSMDGFFKVLEYDLNNVMTEGRRGEKMVRSIYNRYNNESRGQHLEPVPLRMGRYLIALRDLRAKADRFRRNPKTLLSERRILIQRFFNTIVSEARQIQQQAIEDVQRWHEEALMPILQYSQEQKRLLEHQFRRLRDMTHDREATERQRQALRESLDNLTKQLRTAEQMERRIRQPPPSTTQDRVVSMPGIA